MVSSSSISSTSWKMCFNGVTKLWLWSCAFVRRFFLVQSRKLIFDEWLTTVKKICIIFLPFLYFILFDNERKSLNIKCLFKICHDFRIFFLVELKSWLNRSYLIMNRFQQLKVKLKIHWGLHKYHILFTEL